MADEHRHVHLHDPQTLYRHWEEGQWNPWEIDLSVDAEQWGRKLGAEDRDLVHWALSSLMVAEERIATKFTGLVMAYDSEEEESFLATQQVDEVRHMQFYKRFQDEAIADPQTIAVHVERARAELSDDFRAIFDEALVGAHERLAANPRDPEAKVEFVTVYHMVIEGTLGLTAFNFISRYLGEQGMLPGFVRGYERIHHDEQRHIGYGTWYLQQAVECSPALAERVRQTLRDLLPSVASALAPPQREGTDWEALGASAEEIREFAIAGLTRRLNIVGVPLSSL
jgi:ribonucleoside-diphosphate reductase beta chain